MRKAKGLTIVQLMVVLLIAGIVGWFVVDIIIDMRCEADPSKALCADRKAAWQDSGDAVALRHDARSDAILIGV